MSSAGELADKIIPDSLKFQVPKQGPPGTRKIVRMAATDSSYATNTNKIVRFYFPNANVVDFRRGAIFFDLTISNLTNATYARISQGIWSIFQRVYLYTKTTLEDLREYNLIQSMLSESFRDPDVWDVLGELYGFGTQEERNTWGSATKTFSMPLISGFFLSSAVPLSMFSEKVCLEMYLDDPTKFVETDSTTTPIITLTNLYFHYEVLLLNSAMLGTIASMAQAKGVCYPFRTFSYYTQAVVSNTNNLVIPHSSSGIDAFINIMRRTDNMFNMQVNDKFLTWNNNACLQHQLKIDNEYYPLEPTLANNQNPASYLEFIRWIGKWKLGGNYCKPLVITPDEYDNNRFIIVKEVAMYPGEGLVSNVSTNRSGQFVYLLLWLQNQPGNPNNLETYVQHYRCIKFTNGVLSVV
jgi:hypothetical protein